MKRAAAVENGIWQALKRYLFTCPHIPIYANFSTPRSHSEVDGALSTIPKTAEKVSDTRRGDDGVHFSTPRSHNEVDGALSTVLHMNILTHHLRQQLHLHRLHHIVIHPCLHRSLHIIAGAIARQRQNRHAGRITSR